MHAENRFIRKLAHGAALTHDDEQRLLGLAQRVRRVEARGDVGLEGDQPRGLSLVLDGWAATYRLLNNGKRQLVSLFLPGDLCKPFGALPRLLSHDLTAITPVQLATVPLNAIRDAARSSRRIEEALWWDLLLAAAIDRERVSSLGRRTALERLGHLFCELHLRLKLVGLADDTGYDLPLTQIDLADVLGLTPVHVNRSLKDLKGTGMIRLAGRRLFFNDLDGLRALSMFDANHIHLDVAEDGRASVRPADPVRAHDGAHHHGR